jgi:hypothetical protein
VRFYDGAVRVNVPHSEIWECQEDTSTEEVNPTTTRVSSSSIGPYQKKLLKSSPNICCKEHQHLHVD